MYEGLRVRIGRVWSKDVVLTDGLVDPKKACNPEVGEGAIGPNLGAGAQAGD
jgi:hypothetical protein